MDESVSAAIAKLQANPAWLDLSGKYFVLIGATSEMGPLKFLLSHGANVIGIARPSGKWAGLLETARHFLFGRFFAAFSPKPGAF